MNPLNRLAIIGNSLPRRCGIATFTSDLQQALAKSRVAPEIAVVAMNDPGRSYAYPRNVRVRVDQETTADYERAAEFINAGHFDVACLQHEFGIFGGDAGGRVMSLLSQLTVPIVTTLHTVLLEPTRSQREILGQVISASTSVVVMAEKGRELLQSEYGVPYAKIEVIPHGIPEYPFLEPKLTKAKLGFEGKPVVLTFGLLSPNKGIEFMIDAMPGILRREPDAVYIVLGATHPNLIREEGEAYREQLIARARDLGLDNHVTFLNRFVDQATLLEFISMCDVYVTPYLSESQMTSGTLAYSFGLGKAVVSTPYWHARELLRDGLGVLVPFADPAALGAQVADLLTDHVRRNAMRARAYASSRSMTWERTAERYLVAFDKARHAPLVYANAPPAGRSAIPERHALPPMQFRHFSDMCDDTGFFQHARLSVPDRSHGYCVDDNARALLLACTVGTTADEGVPEALTERLAAFIQHAWNPDTLRFRNFMSFDRRWLEESGSEDSHGRTLWALGVCSRVDSSHARRLWAGSLFAEALTAVERFRSPRAWAFTLLGLSDYCAGTPGNLAARDLQYVLAERLMAILSMVETPDWIWFEEGLSYDNARLSQSLIEAGRSTGKAAYVAAGLRSLRWLMSLQTSASGVFRPVGSKTFGEQRKPPQAFDQQPLEAAAAISACLAANRAQPDASWEEDARRALAWFLGENDLSACLVDLETGGCRDGLHPDRPNENRGGESVVSYLLGLAEMRRAAVETGFNRTSIMGRVLNG